MSVRTAIGNYFLKRELARQHRRVAVSNLGAASKVGVLYHADNEQTYKTVKEYVKKLREEGIRKVMTLGFVNKKVLPPYLKVKLEFDYFTKKDLNWYFKPNSVAVNNFLEEEYDILIDLALDDCYPLKYILGKSRARFKVGKHNPEKNAIYDMRIDLKEVKDLRFLITHINHYLNIINKTETHVE